MDASLLAALLANAAVDSVNPCTFYVYTALLLAAGLSSGPRGVARCAAAFIAAVYVGYLLVGLGVSAAAAELPTQALGLAALLYAAYIAARLAAGRRGAGGGGWLARRAVAAAAAGPLAAAAIGFLASMTLLPCSSGPLLAFIAYARARGVPLAELLGLLLLYNAVFVAPLAGIGAAAAAASRARRVQEALARHAVLVEAVSALLLAAVGAYVLLEG